MALDINLELKEVRVGVVGLGLMGSSIVTTMLISGHQVVAVAPIPGEIDTALIQITKELKECKKIGILKNDVDDYLNSILFTEDYEYLGRCNLIMECVVEDVDIKRRIFGEIETNVDETAIIATNTSAIPISFLQNFLKIPNRFLGIHWAEPAYTTRFLEIINGYKTDSIYLDRVYYYAHCWKKEPTVIQKDIRGFLANRLMYAATREAMNLVDKETVTVEDIDKSLKYDAGSWMTFMGIFKRMDYLGLEKFQTIFELTFPTLCNTDDVPEQMKILEKTNAKGVHDKRGFYQYDDTDAAAWKNAFANFNKDIFELAEQYPTVIKEEMIQNSR